MTKRFCDKCCVLMNGTNTIEVRTTGRWAWVSQIELCDGCFEAALAAMKSALLRADVAEAPNTSLRLVRLPEGQTP